MNRFIGYFLLINACVYLSSCAKDEGVGGTSTIIGKVYVKDYSSVGNLLAEYYGQEERVYIIYGDETTYHDEFRTSYDGSYKFQYLNKGIYQIFCYSRCDTCESGQDVVIKKVEITSNNSTLELEDIVINK
jgi:hypothetical protein